MEIIMQFAFSQPAGVIEEQSGTFESRFTQALTTAIHTVFYFYENPWSRRIGKFAPHRVLRFFESYHERRSEFTRGMGARLLSFHNVFCIDVPGLITETNDISYAHF